MPQIGEITRERDLGKGNTLNKLIWHACEVCGKQRWVRLKRGLPNNKYCNMCSSRRRYAPRAHEARHWKGGMVNEQGYIKILLQPDDFFYSMANCNGYVLEHRLVMAKHLGRCLHRWELVHHKNHSKDDNRIENLQLMSEIKHQQLTILEGEIYQLQRRITMLEAEIVLLKSKEFEDSYARINK